MKVFFAAKDLMWRMMPQSIGNKITTLYFSFKKFKKINWMNLQLFIVGKCNLNCTGCNSFAPIADNYLLDLLSLESDLKRWSDLGGAGVISEIRIAGGEPLLHPKLKEIINITHKYLPQAKLKIITNGILLLRQKECFWECCQLNDVDIIISHYPISLDIKSIRKMVRSYKLQLRYYHGTLPWFKFEYDLAGGGNFENNFRKCINAILCPELREGKISTCSHIFNIVHFNSFFHKDIEIMKTDFMDIYKAKNMDEILEFISRPVPFCRYCTLKYTPLKWGLSQKAISEWV
jgi:hypothetical protein